MSHSALYVPPARSYGALENRFLVVGSFLVFAAIGFLAMGVMNAGLVFSAILGASVITYRPKYFIEPLTVLIFYYAAFFVTPLFAQRYGNISFTHENVVLAYRMATVTFSTGASVFFLMRPPEGLPRHEPFANLRKLPLEAFAWINLPICLTFGYLLFEGTGGFERWSELGGLAILQRRGSGGLTVAFMFSSFMELATLGYLGLVRGKRSYLIGGILLLALLSPLYGGKLRIAQGLMILLAPMIFRMKLFSRSSLALGLVFFLIFMGVNTWRAASWITWRHFIPGTFPPLYQATTGDSGYIYFETDTIDATQQTIWSHSLNYFDVLENTLIALQDMADSTVFTLLMPFNKLREFTGANLEAADYDLGSYLTRTYYPAAYDLGATTQWPIEIDLWLSFGFSPLWIIAVPLFMLFGYIYKMSRIYEGPQVKMIWIFTFGYLVSHLRGGFFIWTDLYVFPIFAFYFFLISIFFRTSVSGRPAGAVAA